jgi:hypothetical protein
VIAPIFRAVKLSEVGTLRIHSSQDETSHNYGETPLIYFNDYIKKASVIIWDEAPMQSRWSIEAVDRSLQDLMDKPGVPFGGKLMVFGGDFRQVLPVLPKASRGTIVSMILKNSHLWNHMTVMHLTINERVNRSGNINDA